MFAFMKTYVRCIDAMNRLVGRLVLYLVFVVMAILLFAAVSRYCFNNPVIWSVELSQFVVTVYYLLGGGFALLLHSHARMDVFYTRWPRKRQAGVDAFTSLFLVVYLGFLLYGACSSTLYSLEFGQRNNTAWGPPIAPVKCVMVLGIALTLLQAISEFFKDFARARGVLIGVDIPELVLIETNSTEKMRKEPEEHTVHKDHGLTPVLAPVEVRHS